jgi:hypothetical protein
MKRASLDVRVQAVDVTTLTPLVRQTLGRATGCVTHWGVQPVQSKTLGGGMGASAIYRFLGSFQDGEQVVRWSLILKIIPDVFQELDGDAPKRSALPREVAFYRSDLVHQLPAGVRAARCFAISAQFGDEAQREFWLWLEALESQPAGQWTLDDHYQLAYSLGLLNGAFLANRPLPVAPWLAYDGVRNYLAHAAPLVNQWVANQEHPLVQRAFPATTIASFVALWQARERHLQTLAMLPQTLCHGDAQVSNLFLSNRTGGPLETVAIDWADVGVGPLGLDLAQLISFSLGTNKVEMDQASTLDQAGFEGYLAGLQAIDWRGDPRVVRLGYTAAALKTRTTGVIRAIPFLIDETVRRQAESKLKAQGLTFENMLDIVARSALFFEKLFHESLELRDELL